ncbi:MAG TPA: four-helix bundle copper-binding protein [Ktedonobacteraceae bacterium]|nr:four-helix bundle copper-binding protein [Ktedonobacteraceae bacterium]
MQEPPIQGEQALIGQMQDCIDDCLNSHNVCLDTAMSLLQQGGQADNVRILLDCSEICLTAAHFMMRNSPLHGYTCQACASVCTHCADLCSQIGQNDCANACNASANSCQQMVKMVAY